MSAAPIHPRLPGIAIRLGLAALLLVAGRPASAESQAASDAAPDLDAILRRVVENAARDPGIEDRFRATHAFVRVKVTDSLDADGAVKKREAKREEHDPRRANAAAAVDPEGDAAETPVQKARRAYERRDFAVTSALLRRFEFRLVGSEEVEGRPAWVIDFTPAANQPPVQGLKEKFLSRTAGRVWVDVSEGFLARGRFQLTGPVHVVGGLVGSLKHCHIALERARTTDGLWFTRLLTWRIEGRKLFSRRILQHRDELSEIRPVAGRREEPLAPAVTSSAEPR
jgi:hypothetical protein